MFSLVKNQNKTKQNKSRRLELKVHKKRLIQVYMSRKSTLNLKVIKRIIIVSKFSSIFVEAITKSKIELMLMYQRCYEILLSLQSISFLPKIDVP